MSTTYLVIGASTGLGRATARALARHHRVVVAGRDVAQARAAVPAATDAVAVDLASLASVRRFTDEVAALGPFEGVVCNAGVQPVGAPVLTVDGHESTFAVNHLAHLAIVVRLWSQLSPTARVAFVASGTVDGSRRLARRFGFRGGRYTTAAALARGEGDPDVDETQRARDRYATSKQCNLLTMAALTRRVAGSQRSVVALDPGLMPGTGLARAHAWPARLAWHTLMRVAALFMAGTSTAGRSGATLAWLVSERSLPSGSYLDARRRPIARWPGDDRADWAEDLLTTSLTLLGGAPATSAAMLALA